MTLTLLALFLLPTSLLAVINPKEAQRALKNTVETPEGRLIAGVLTTFFGLFVFAFSSHDFDFEWTHLMTWLGALISLKGVVLNLFPAFSEKITKKINKVEWLPVLGFIRLLIALALIYIDTQVIAS